MLSLLGFHIPLPPALDFLAAPTAQFLINATAWLGIAFIVNFILLRVLRFITRQLPGELEDIMFAILRGPLVFLILVYGAVNSLELLPLSELVRRSIRLLTYTIVVVVVTHILGRTLRDVVVYYGEKWARKTESRVDDVLIPVLNLFGPVVLVLAAALVILPMWGVNVSSVLVGAGVIGLVLGLALQDTLANVFSGLSLLVEAPFGNGDLIIAPDGRMCEVKRIGMRSTLLYSINEHALVYVPNRTLADSTLTNMTKPTSDQRYSLEINVGPQANIARTEEVLLRVASAHPAVLAPCMRDKLPFVREQIEELRAQAAKLGENDPARGRLMLEAERNEKVIGRLDLEGQLDERLLAMQDLLRGMIRGIMTREGKGLTEAERQEIYCSFISPIDNAVQEVVALAKAWSAAEDPWLDHSDYWDLRRLWDQRGELLLANWERVKKAVYNPDDRTEMRLDDITKGLLRWIQEEYKMVPPYWKRPRVILKSLDADRAVLELSFYVDNIRLEHDERASRVRTEIGRQVREALGGVM